MIYNLPVGHGSVNGFLPLGVKAKIVADYNNPQLIITENYAENKLHGIICFDINIIEGI